MKSEPHMKYLSASWSIWINMITVSKGILHVMLACKWRYTLLTRPHMSKKWGGGPIDCECGGRIVEVRSTKQSVIKVLTPKSLYLNVISLQPVIDLQYIGEHLGTGHQLSVPGFSIIRRTVQERKYFFRIYEGTYRSRRI